MPSSSDHDLDDIGVAIVNYNAGDEILACLASVISEGVTNIVVADNGSTDGSDRDIERDFPDVKLLRLPNPGMGAGLNRCAEQLTTTFIFCLNPDTRMHPGAIRQLRQTLTENPSAGLVAPRLSNDDGTLYPSARQFPNVGDAIGHATVGMFKSDNKWSRSYKRLDTDYNSRHEVDWVSGAAMFFLRTAWDQVNGFDESYFLFFEEVDICWRLHEAGWNVIYEPAAVVTHIVGVSMSAVPYRSLKAHHLSAIRYTTRSTRGAQKLLLPLFIGGLLARLPVAMAQKRVERQRQARRRLSRSQ